MRNISVIQFRENKATVATISRNVTGVPKNLEIPEWCVKSPAEILNLHRAVVNNVVFKATLDTGDEYCTDLVQIVGNLRSTLDDEFQEQVKKVTTTVNTNCNH